MGEELLSEAIKALELRDIYLHQSSLLRDDFFDSNTCLEEQIVQQSKLKVDGEILEPNSENGEPILLRAKIQYGVRLATLPNTENEKILSEITADFVVIYVMKNPVSDDSLSEFLQFNAVHNSWSFWREYVFTTARKANLPVPNIPFFHGKSKALKIEKVND